MIIYELYFSHYDEYTPYYFHSSKSLSQEEWKSLCDSYLSQAVDKAIEEAKEKFFSKVGWSDIVRCLVPILEANGFRRFQPVKCGYAGPSVIKRRKDDENEMLGNRLRDVIAHNRTAEERMNIHRLAEYDSI